MQYRLLGNTNLRVSEIGFGCARIGGLFQRSTRDEQLRLLGEAQANGINFYDTADMYAQGGSEQLLGEAFAGHRERVIIASKVGYRFSSERSLAARAKPLLKPVVARLGLTRQRVPRQMLHTVSAQDFSTDYMSRMLEASLRRLRTDYLDLYQLHSPPIETLARGEAMQTLERLKEQGKIRHWGVACETAEDAMAALECSGVGTIQVPLSVLHQEALRAVLPAAAARGVGVIARQIFASGLLTSSAETLPSDRLGDSDPAAELRRRQLRDYEHMASENGRTLAELALKFVLANDEIGVALLGMHRRGHLTQCMQYFEAQDLTQGELRELGVASSAS